MKFKVNPKNSFLTLKHFKKNNISHSSSQGSNYKKSSGTPWIYNNYILKYRI